MINPASQPQCPSRAEWRLQTGKAAKPLSPHYRLGCDYGTTVIMLWKEGGGEPIYVCDDHAKQLGRSREHFPDAHIVTALSEQGDSPTQCEDRTHPQDVVEIKADKDSKSHKDSKPDKSVSPEAAPSLADAKAGRTQTQEVTGINPDSSASSEAASSLAEAKPEPPQMQEVAAKKSNHSPSSEAASSIAEAKPERTLIEPRDKPSVRDMTFGSSAKAMVDEAIWNMSTGDYRVYRTALLEGKSPSEAAEAAGGQLAFIHRKINDYTLKLEAIFSTSQATINVEETIDKPLEQAMLEIINNDAMSDLEKDAATEQLGTLQQWVKQGLQGEITPLQANRIILALGDRLNWGGNSRVSENFKTVCRTLYGGLRAALCTAAPEAQNVHERLTNLYAAKSEMDAR